MTYSPNFAADNMTVRNFAFLPEGVADSLITARCERQDAFDGFKVSNVRVGRTKALIRGKNLKVDGLVAETEPQEGPFTEQIHELPHPYGRYHRYFHDRRIKNRPADSRWANEEIDD